MNDEETKKEIIKILRERTEKLFTVNDPLHSLKELGDDLLLINNKLIDVLEFAYSRKYGDFVTVSLQYVIGANLHSRELAVECGKLLRDFVVGATDPELMKEILEGSALNGKGEAIVNEFERG
jgi:hypothetical protein